MHWPQLLNFYLICLIDTIDIWYVVYIALMTVIINECFSYWLFYPEPINISFYSLIFLSWVSNIFFKFNSITQTLRQVCLITLQLTLLCVSEQFLPSPICSWQAGNVAPFYFDWLVYCKLPENKNGKQSETNVTSTKNTF